MAKGELLGEFENVVLLAVARLGENGYGMTVRREIERRTGRDVSIGAVYATLDRLERKGLVASNMGGPRTERGGRARRYFRLAAAGERALVASREALQRLWEGLELTDRPGQA